MNGKVVFMRFNVETDNKQPRTDIMDVSQKLYMLTQSTDKLSIQGLMMFIVN